MIPSLLTDTISMDLDRAIHYALLWGLEGVELRTVGGAGNRVPFVNESKIRSRLRESELAPVAVVPGMFECEIEDKAAWLNDISALEETLQFCRRIGCVLVVASGFTRSGESPDGGALESAAAALRRAGDLAHRHGITVGVINESGTLAPTGAELAALVAAAGNVLAVWNPSDALMAGENPLDGLRSLSGRIALVRCRNGVSKGNGWEARSIDRGEIDWIEQIRELKSEGFEGPITLEVTGEPAAKNGLHDSTLLIQYIRTAHREASGR